MNTDALIVKVKNQAGVKLPAHKLLRWAREGLISPPAYKGHKGGGRFAYWPPEAVEQAIIIYTLRHSELPWGTTKQGEPTRTGKGTTISTKRLLEVKELVERFYAGVNSINKSTQNVAEINDFFGVLQPIQNPVNVPVEVPTGGCMYGGEANHPVFVTWICTLEKIRHQIPLSAIVKLTFHVNTYLDKNGAPKKMFDGISVTPSDRESVGLSRRYAPGVVKQLFGIDPIDREKEEREGNVIHMFSPTLTVVNRDYEKQQEVISDPFQGLKNVGIDWSGSGLKMLKPEEGAAIAAQAQRNGECIQKLREFGCMIIHRATPEDPGMPGLDWVQSVWGLPERYDVHKKEPFRERAEL
jgi:hypothetical protein